MTCNRIVWCVHWRESVLLVTLIVTCYCPLSSSASFWGFSLLLSLEKIWWNFSSASSWGPSHLLRISRHSTGCDLLHGHREGKGKVAIGACAHSVMVSKFQLTPKTIGNKKRDCAWGWARGINTTWENLQIEKHKSGRRSFRSPDWFVLFNLEIFSGSVYPPSATSRTISFSISNNFWY